MKALPKGIIITKNKKVLPLAVTGGRQEVKKMNTAIAITAIICVTLILITMINRKK